MEEFLSKGFDNEYFKIRYGFDGRRRRVWKAIAEYLQDNLIGNPECIVEIGPGYGDFINQIKAERKIAVDVADVGNFLDHGVEFYRGDVVDLSFLESDIADVIFASNVLEHLTRDQIASAVKEIHRVLKLGGLLVLLQPNFRLCCAHYFDDYTHVTVFTDESLCGLLLANGFEIAARRNRFLPFSMTGKLPKSYWLTKLYLRLKIPFLAGQMLVAGRKNLDVS